MLCETVFDQVDSCSCNLHSKQSRGRSTAEVVMMSPGIARVGACSEGDSRHAGMSLVLRNVDGRTTPLWSSPGRRRVAGSNLAWFSLWE
jgi:hypothetical protein